MSSKVDMLNRQPLVDRLIKLVNIITESEKGCTFSLDGKWGSGKTFVLEKFEEQLSMFQNPESAEDKYVVFHYNCWQYDFYEEPAIAIVAAIRNEIAKYSRVLPNLPESVRASLNVAKDIGKEILRSFLMSKLRFDPIKLIEKYKGELNDIEITDAEQNEFDTYYRFKEVLDETRNQLAAISSEKPIIFVVDELDRCLPDYAIKVLERLHHLFDEESNVIVILAVDKDQLKRTIHQIFGLETDASEDMCSNYLKKFINFSVSLDAGEITEAFWEKYSHILARYDVSDDVTELYSTIPNELFCNLEARSIERSMEQMHTLHRLSFGDINNSVVLCFELIYQAIALRIPIPENYEWLKNINQNNEGRQSALGVPLLKFLRNLKLESTMSSSLHASEYNYQYINDSVIGGVFWLFLGIGQTKIGSRIYSGYAFDQYEKYRPMVEAAQKYHQLSRLIK